jgi:YesN/AraC family two-component response regulator
MKTVLIADDNEVLLEAFRAGLKKYENEFNTVYVENGYEALNVLNSQPIDLVITDIQMPMMDGLVLLAFMRENFPKLPCIIMSSYGTPGLKEEIKNDILHFIDKPVAIDKMAKLILSTLNAEKKDTAQSRIAIADLLKMIMKVKKTCIFKLHASDGKKGFFYFHEGELFNASWGKHQGEKAVMMMLACEEAELTFTKAPDQKGIKRVNKSLAELLELAKSSNLSITSSSLKKKE